MHGVWQLLEEKVSTREKNVWINKTIFSNNPCFEGHRYLLHALSDTDSIVPHALILKQAAQCEEEQYWW
jgi:hypothetical protein